ncbi:MAG: hypothetical protein K0R57_5596 [Paenibacillaceae bacterium]|jgi:lysophospholipase L1-like esterase|nr:hypothetical protein [Paenibacillaceae bacterium]
MKQVARIILLFTAGLVVTAVIASGVYFGNKKMAAEASEQGKLAQAGYQRFKEQEAARIAAEIEKWKPNGNPRSYLDDLRYIKARKQSSSVTISTLGSSVTQGTGASDPSKNWSSLLANYLSQADGYTIINVNNNGFGGRTAGGLLKESKVELVIEQSPDIVIFENCLLNDHGQSVPLVQSVKDITAIVDDLKAALPEAVIYVISPNPKAEDVANSLGLTMKDYAANARSLAEKAGWAYMDVYEGFTTQGADMYKLTVDGTHPNDSGYKRWFEIMKAEFEKIK